jgi:hypothetical protein
MAVQNGSGKWLARGVHQVTWALMLNGDTGTPASDTTLSNKEVSCTGTFGAAGSLAWEGSNDGVNYNPVKDWQGTAVVFTAAGNKTIVDNPQFLRPHITAGDGTTSLQSILTSQADM